MASVCSNNITALELYNELPIPMPVMAFFAIGLLIGITGFIKSLYELWPLIVRLSIWEFVYSAMTHQNEQSRLIQRMNMTCKKHKHKYCMNKLKRKIVTHQSELQSRRTQNKQFCLSSVCYLARVRHAFSM